MNVNTSILNFIRRITEENYAAANKYLKLALTEKLKNKIKSAVKTQRIF